MIKITSLISSVIPKRSFRNIIVPRILQRRNYPYHTSSKVSSLNNITYSGGHPTEGQGGFYGSGGSRVQPASELTQRLGAVALFEDVQKLSELMERVFVMEAEILAAGNDTALSIKLRTSLKKLMTSSATSKLMDRLEINGAPVWGLSQSERELVKAAREVINTC
mmetsp:Transcript_35757/g.47189  ORF Transcript_35757/g.47189 Transcript_35757/m.47189 type:complete len:165 (-) Transcript_35757:346-840(-)